jgi:nucleoside-diphosphate-sugar epimerase
MNILITGDKGFVAKNLIPHLKKKKPQNYYIRKKNK